MSVAINIENAIKRYNENIIIPNLGLSIKEGEFFTLLGPSGCGKTTLLRMIAGFNSIDGGRFSFNDKCINDVDPAKRNIGMVFQNYAIFPHLTTRKNVEFGLRNRKVSAEQIKLRTDKFLKLMQIEQLADRKPEKMSGGQQQRVALARALVIEPDVLLMDEPLSNLDAKLRVEMRSVIKNIQKQIGITTVYVTHDQEEAMAISDRIAVMNGGVLQHIGEPKDIYQRPANLFVATFIGRSNIIDGMLSIEGAIPYIKLKNNNVVQVMNVQQTQAKEQEIKISIRPEEFVLCKSDEEGEIKGVIRDSIFLGLNTHYVVQLETGEEVEIIQESTRERIMSQGSEVSLKLNVDKINIFTKEGISIMDGICNDAI